MQSLLSLWPGAPQLVYVPHGEPAPWPTLSLQVTNTGAGRDRQHLAPMVSLLKIKEKPMQAKTWVH